TPQDLGTSSDVKFGSIATGGNVYINNTGASTDGYGRLQITGAASDLATCPGLLASTTAPVFNLVPFSFEDIELLFSCYRTDVGQWKSTSDVANWKIAKQEFGELALQFAE